MTTTLETVNHQQLTGRVAKAKAIWQSILDAEGQLKRQRDHMLILAHRLGRELSEFKEIIGHGKWLLWLTANFKELGPQSEDYRVKNAQRFMALYQRNPEAMVAGQLDEESVRKFMWYYVPAKERTALAGDQKDAQTPHYLTFVNNFNKWDRQIAIGQIALPPIETLRHELEGPQRRIIEICGIDWVRSLMQTAAE